MGRVNRISWGDMGALRKGRKGEHPEVVHRLVVLGEEDRVLASTRHRNHKSILQLF